MTNAPRRSLVAAAMNRLGRHPRAAVRLLRLPQLMPATLRTRAYRSFSWPAAKRLGVALDVPVVGGSTLRVHTADAVGRTLAVSGVWEPNVTTAFTRALAPGDVCVDVGAHIGYFTVLAARLVGRDGHVYSFEPSPKNFPALAENVTRNGVQNVTAIEAAVGATPGRTILYEGPGTNTGRATLNPALAQRVSTEERGVGVDVTTIADAIPASDFPRVRVVKVDVEGAEVDVLRSLEPILAAGQPISVFLEVNPKWLSATDADYVGRLCRTHGFTLFRVRTGYGLEDLFPRRLVPPVELDDVPAEPADLLLTR